MGSHQPKLPEEGRTTSHGRGGAGNINALPNNTVGSKDLKTPTLKTNTYTTGRGGSGNMAANSNPAEARMAQDVEAPAYHQNDPKGTYHWGRGGEGNMMTVGGGDNKYNSEEKSKEKRSGSGTGQRSGSFSVLQKGKEMLGMKGKEGAKGGSAVED